MAKRNVVIAAFVAIMVTSAFLISGCSKKGSSYVTEPIKKCTIVETVDASGVINPVQTVNVGSQVSGMISDIFVDFNSVVKKGQLLAQIDPTTFQAQVDKAQSDLAAARSNAAKVKSVLVYDKENYERYRRLYAKNYVSKSDLDLAEATYKSNSAQLASMNAMINQSAASLKNNQTNLNYTRIISPVDGIVVSRSVDVGQTVAASFNTPTLFMVAKDLKKMQIEVNVSEADIGKVKMGQEVEYTLDGYPDATFRGEVSQVRISPTTVQNVVTYNVIVLVDNPDEKLKPGMSANVSIVTNKSEGVLCAPLQALRFTPTELTGGKKFKEQGIWIMENKVPKRVEIQTGAKDSDVTEVISSEITEGTQIITAIKGKDKKKQSGGTRPPGMF